MKKRTDNGLVLGGGGAKGFAHLGAAIEMEARSLRPDMICGTSAGALAGAFYALNAEGISSFADIESRREFRILKGLKLSGADFSEEKQGFFLKTLSTIKAKFSMIKMLRDSSLLKTEEVVPVFRELFGDTPFESTRIPFVAAAFDIISGRDIYIKNGPLWKGVMASCSIPGIFPPVKCNGMLLVDGGVTNRLPIKCAILSGAENIVAIDISGDIDPGPDISSVVNLHLRIDALLTNRFDMVNRALADLVIKPEMGRMKWNDFNMYALAMEEGGKAVETAAPRMRSIRSRGYGYRKKIRSMFGDSSRKKLRLAAGEEHFFM